MGESLWQGVNIWNAGDSRSKETPRQYKSTGHEQTVVERRNTSDQEILGKEVMLLPTEIASHPESERVSSRETMTTNAARMWWRDRHCWWTRKLMESLRVSPGTQNNYPVPPGWTPDEEQLINKIGTYKHQNVFRIKG